MVVKLIANRRFRPVGCFVCYWLLGVVVGDGVAAGAGVRL
jgi:hypothetical protein